VGQEHDRRVTGEALLVAWLTLLAVPEVRWNPASESAAPVFDGGRIPSISTRVSSAGTANKVSRATPGPDRLAGQTMPTMTRRRVLQTASEVPFTLLTALLLASLAGLAAVAAEKKEMPKAGVVDVPAIGPGLCVANVFQSNMVLQRDRPLNKLA